MKKSISNLGSRRRVLLVALTLIILSLADVPAQVPSPATSPSSAQNPSSTGTSSINSSPTASPEGALREGLQKSGSTREDDYVGLVGLATKVKGWFSADKVSEKTTNILRIANILAAVLIGTLGALAFYAGVKFGFISRDTRKTLLEYLPEDAAALRQRKHFYFMGGIVAGIFQWAQPDVLAPIQAFVLGATWPSVVTRIMSGSTNPVPTVSPEKKVENIVETPPDKIATTSGKSATDAVVVIGGPTEPPKPPTEPPKPPTEPPKPPTEPPKPPTEPPKPPTEPPKPSTESSKPPTEPPKPPTA